MPATSACYDVVIVGGGVTGSSTAFWLGRDPDFRGRVLVIERDDSYQGSATARAASSVRHQFSNAINVRISQFGAEFMRNFQSYVEVDGEAPDLQFHEQGYLLLAGDPAGRRVLERNHRVQVECGAETSLLDPDALARRFPWLNVAGLTVGSVGESGEGWFDNFSLLQGLRRKARQLGAEYVEDEVVEVERAGDRVVSVRTRCGQTIACGALVNACGTRGPALARLAGLDIPVEARRRTVFVVTCPTRLEGPVGLTVDPTGVWMRPEGHQFLTATTPEPDVAVDPEDFTPRRAEFEEQIWPVLAERVPAFDSLRVVRAWAGHYDFCTLDHNVVLGPHPEVTNFLFANGFSGHGLQQAPAVGRGLSELLAHGAYQTLDLSPLGYQRVVENRPFVEDAVI